MRKLLVCDLDGSLVRGSAVLQFTTWLIDKKVIPDTEYRKQWEADQKNEKLIVLYAEHLKKSIKGLDIDDIDKHAIEFVNSDVLKYYESSMKIVNDCLKQNYIGFILSGSCHFLVARIAEKLGLHAFGSVYEVDKFGKFTGEITVPMYLGTEKTKILNRIIFEKYTENVIGIGDTSQDVYSLGIASDEFYLVEPTHETIETANKLMVDYTILL